MDHAVGAEVALKIVRNKKRFHRQGLIEIRLLETLCAADSAAEAPILRLQGSFCFRDHLVMVMPLLGPNLYDLLLQTDLRGVAPKKLRPIAA